MSAITQENIQFIISIATLLGILFAIFKFFRDPDIKAGEKIGLMAQSCLLRHQGIDKDIKLLEENYTLLKENHIRHIENDIGELKITMTKILTILEERNKNKTP